MNTARSQPVVTAELKGQDSEGNGSDELADQLRCLVQSQIALLADLDEVVEETDSTERGGQTENE